MRYSNAIDSVFVGVNGSGVLSDRNSLPAVRRWVRREEYPALHLHNV